VVHVLDVEKKGADVLTYQVSAGVGGNPGDFFTRFA